MSWKFWKCDPNLTPEQQAEVQAIVAEEGRQTRRHSEHIVNELRKTVDFNQRSDATRAHESLQAMNTRIKQEVESQTWVLVQRIGELADSLSSCRALLLELECAKKTPCRRTAKKAPRKRVTKRSR